LVGGASTHAASNLSKGVSSGIAKAATRITVQASTAAATDAGLQLAQNGEIDAKQLLLNTAGQITVATTAEVSQNLSQRADTYKKKINSEMIKDNIDKEPVADKKELNKKLNAIANDLNNLKMDDVEMKINEVKEYNKVRSDVNQLEEHKRILKVISDNDKLNPRQKAEVKKMYAQKHDLPETKTMKNINKRITTLNERLGELKPEKAGPNNMHFLHGERTGQIAVDLIDTETGERSGERAIFEKNGNKIVYTDHTMDHDYKNCRNTSSNIIPDPHDALRPEHFYRDLPDEDDDLAGTNLQSELN
jgi:signal recognition particle subunit SEC65